MGQDEYLWEKFATYGPCHDCGGPQDHRMWVVQRDDGLTMLFDVCCMNPACVNALPTSCRPAFTLDTSSATTFDPSAFLDQLEPGTLTIDGPWY